MTSATEYPAGTKPRRWPDRIGRGLMGFNVLFTLVAVAGGISRIAAADDQYLLAEAWRTSAYVVFAALWLIIAIAPRWQFGIWELLIVQKTFATLFGVAFFTLPEGSTFTGGDGGRVVSTVAAYVLCRGWQAWGNIRRARLA